MSKIQTEIFQDTNDIFILKETVSLEMKNFYSY